MRAKATCGICCRASRRRQSSAGAAAADRARCTTRVALARLLHILRDFRPHIVHTHMAKAGTIGRAGGGDLQPDGRRRALARVVHTYHGHVLEGYFSPAKTRVFLGIERGLARVTDCLVAISPRDPDRAARRTSASAAPHQYRVIPLGFELGRPVVDRRPRPCRGPGATADRRPIGTWSPRLDG